MPYPLDFTDVRYETDYAGNRLTATIPYAMFTALTELWVARRESGALRHETLTRPGQWAAMEAPPAESASAPASAPSGTAGRRVFYREFAAQPPIEVIARIRNGTYFTRAWREYRGLTTDDAAALYGCDRPTILWHESGKSPPSRRTLEKLARIYDCPLAQMIPKPGSDDSPYRGLRPGPGQTAGMKKRTRYDEPRSPSDTDYPDTVLAHLLAGKSPMLAWRLYRGMTVKQVAAAYGTSNLANIKLMEQHGWLRRKTIDKLCAIFDCQPDQLLRPEGMPDSQAEPPDYGAPVPDHALPEDEASGTPEPQQQIEAETEAETEAEAEHGDSGQEAAVMEKQTWPTGD